MHPNTDQASSTRSPMSNRAIISRTSSTNFINHSTPSESNNGQILHPASSDTNATSNIRARNSVGIRSTSIYHPFGAESATVATVNSIQLIKPAIKKSTFGTRSTTSTPKNQSDSSRLLTEEIKITVREEIEKIASELIKKEIEKEIESKIGSKKIGTSRRSRVYRKVDTEIRKQIQETIDKVVEEQLNTAHKNVEEAEGNETDIEGRVSNEIASKLSDAIRSLLNRSMEKAIADEMIEQVKIEKLTRTPTIIPEFRVPATFGVRHTQTFMVLLFLLISYWQRVDFNIAEVAMIDSGSGNPYFTKFAWSEATLSFLLSSFYWGYFTLQIPGGILAEKYGPKLVMSVAMMICSLLGLLIPVGTLIGDWVALWILKFFQGAAQGVFVPAVYVFTSRWIPPKEKSKLFTPAFGGMQLGVVFGLPVTGILCDSFLGWPSAFFFSSCIGFFWVAVWIILAANSPSVHRSISREEKLYIEGSFGFGEITLKGAEKIIPWKSIFKCIPFWALVICHFGQNWALTTLITEMPLYIHHILDMNITENAFYSAMTYFVGWVFIVIFGILAHYIENKHWISLGLQRKAWNSVSAIGGTTCFLILGITQTRSEVLAITLLTIAITTNSACYNGLFSNHADLSPNYIGILMGLSNMVGNLASVMGPLYVGYAVKDAENVDQWSWVFITSAIVLFGSNVIFVLFGSSEIQPWNTPSDLHLHLENVSTDTDALSYRRKPRRGQTYVVANTRHDAVPDHYNKIHSPQASKPHRNSI